MMSRADGEGEREAIEKKRNPSEHEKAKIEQDGSETKRLRLSSDENPPSKKAKRVGNKHVDKRVLHVRRILQNCCATDDLATAMEEYDKAVSDGVRIEAQSFYNLLSLCAGLGDRGIHIGTPQRKPNESVMSAKENDESNEPDTRQVSTTRRKEHAFRIKQHMDNQRLPLNETAYSGLIRMLASEHDEVDRAMELLDQAEITSQCKPRLRLYSSLLCTYCQLGAAIPALNLWGRLAKRDLVLTEKEYAALMRCAVKACDPVIMERVLSELAEDVLIPSRETLCSITDWFKSSSASVEEGDYTIDSTGNSSSIHGVELPQREAPSMGPIICDASQKWIISRDCSVNSKTGCLTSGCLSGQFLQPVTLTPAHWANMKEMNETIVLHGMLENDKSKFQGGGKGLKRAATSKHEVESKKSNWDAFRWYLTQRSCNTANGPIDVVIDGANVGYYKQNFSRAPKHVDYRQIDGMVRKFRQSHKSVLLILHERHFGSNLMPSWADPIVAKWNDVLYKANFGMNDDWFWMHAALENPGALVVTNDEMRDHHFQLLHARSFVRWKERHQVKFSFRGWIKNNTERQIVLSFPDPYSRRIQRLNGGGLVVPIARKGDERRFLDGTHVADDDAPKEETYVCIVAIGRT